MKHNVLSISVILAASLLAASDLWAKPPFPTPPKGGLPQCKADLAGCNSDLGEAQANLVACQNNLTACQDRLAAIDTEILVIDDNLMRRPAGSTSGSGDTVEANCPADPSDNAWQGATASFQIRQSGTTSRVTMEIRGAVPNTLYDVFLRLKGEGPDGSTIGVSPLTGGGATPLAPGSALDALIGVSPPFLGTANPVSGFTTDANGDAEFEIDLDFPVVGGAYPFQRASAQAIDNWQVAGGNPNAERRPTPIANPADPDISAPFLIRIVSHCTDNLTHGLSPATREAWFQYP